MRCKFHMENASPGIFYQDEKCENVNDSTFTFTISQVLGQDISIHSPPFIVILRKCNISAHNLNLYQSNNCCTCQDQLIHVHHFSSHSLDFESFGDSVLGGIFSIISFSDKTDYLLPLSGQKTKRPADFLHLHKLSLRCLLLIGSDLGSEGKHQKKKKYFLGL